VLAGGQVFDRNQAAAQSVATNAPAREGRSSDEGQLDEERLMGFEPTTITLAT